MANQEFKPGPAPPPAGGGPDAAKPKTPLPAMPSGGAAAGKPPNIPAAASSQPAPPPANNEIVIRTMQDDLTTSRTGQNTPPRTIGAQAPLPAAPGAAETANKVIVAPRKRRRRRWPLFLLIIILLLAAAGAGFYFWSDLFPLTTAPDIAPTDSTTSANVTEVIPADAIAILQYNAETTGDLSAIQSAWEETGTESNLTNLLRGDPRAALDAAITELYYVVLPDDPRPYLLVPQSPAADNLLVGNPDAQVMTVSGWHIAHSVSIDLYTAALESQTLAGVGGSSFLTAETTDAPLKFALGPGALIRLRRNLLNTGLENGQLQDLSLAARFSAPAGIELAGTGVALNQPPAELANQQLLSKVPGTANFVHVGGNFNADVNNWSGVTGALDDDALQSPQVKALLEQLTGSYAFYLDQSVTTNTAYGLVISLPAELVGTLSLGDQGLEEALRALVPLLTGQRTIAPIPFNDGAYAETPLRFANLAGSTQAIDYAITDDAILVATSKDAMFALLDIALGQADSVTASASYTGLFQLWKAIPEAAGVTLGSAEAPVLDQLLPLTVSSNETRRFLFGFTTSADAASSNVTISGVLQLAPNVTAASTDSEEAAAASPAPTTEPTASPTAEPAATPSTAPEGSV